MQSTFTQEIDFRQERDFGAKISATFEFLKAHWRPLGKCFVYFVLPAALLMGVGMGLFTNATWNQLANAKNGVPTVQPAFSVLGIALIVLGGLSAMILLLGTLYGYISLRMALPPEQTVTPRLVWKNIVAKLGRVFLGFLLVGAVFGVMVLGLGFLLMKIHPMMSIPVMFIFMYLFVPLTLFYPLLWLEDDNVISALQRSFRLTYGHWWSTFGLYMVISILQVLLVFVFALPQYAVLIGKMMKVPGLESDVLGVIAQCIYVMGLMVTYAIPLTALVFQYFNLVEKREGWGMYLQVEALGQTNAPIVANTYYRADDEGEY
ncbi:hypothetical protein [Hymenobacter sp. BT730]|uniref:hypothetical protein n=1 Tax=Hymenobacter sp. BT730 TaxID=3063332 RepID=UPI0026E00C0E|nr:hypothetical protein [Hymenobacter sp. BT730]